MIEEKTGKLSIDINPGGMRIQADEPNKVAGLIIQAVDSYTVLAERQQKRIRKANKRSDLTELLQYGLSVTAILFFLFSMADCSGQTQSNPYQHQHQWGAAK